MLGAAKDCPSEDNAGGCMVVLGCAIVAGTLATVAVPSRLQPAADMRSATPPADQGAAVWARRLPLVPVLHGVLWGFVLVWDTYTAATFWGCDGCDEDPHTATVPGSNSNSSALGVEQGCDQVLLDYGRGLTLLVVVVAGLAMALSCCVTARRWWFKRAHDRLYNGVSLAGSSARDSVAGGSRASSPMPMKVPRSASERVPRNSSAIFL